MDKDTRVEPEVDPASDTISRVDKETFQVFIDISALNLSAFTVPNCLVFCSTSKETCVSDIVRFITLKTDVPKNSIFLKSICGNYISQKDTINVLEIQNIVLFLKAKGGVRRKRGSFHHHGKQCGPCYICKNECSRYMRLHDRTDMIQYFKDKNPDIELNHCVCKSCELTCRRYTGTNDKNVSQSNPSEEFDNCCYLSHFNLCSAPQNLKDVRTVKINEADMTQVFSLPVDATSFNIIPVILCSHHRLKYFNDNRFNCSICHKRFVRGIYKKKIPDNMLDFAKIFVSLIPGNKPNEKELTVNDYVCNGCFYAVKKYVR